MNENILKVICIIVGLAAGFFLVPLMAGVFMLLLQIIFGIIIAFLLYKGLKKNSRL